MGGERERGWEGGEEGNGRVVRKEKKGVGGEERGWEGEKGGVREGKERKGK